MSDCHLPRLPILRSFDYCEALNASGGVLSAVGSQTFVQVSEGSVQAWHWPGAGIPNALVVNGTMVAAVGRFGRDARRLTVGTLVEQAVTTIADIWLTIPGGPPLPVDARKICCGPDLHVITDTGWYRLSL